jgi:PAS domain S-box-containing protein
VSRALLFVLAGVGAFLYAAAIVLVASSDTDDLPVIATAAIFAGVTFVVTGILATARRPENRTGPLMLAVGYLWSLGALTESSNGVTFTLGILLGQLAFAPLSQLLLSFPSGVLERRSERRLVAAVWAAVVTFPLLIVLVTPDVAPSCDDCPDNAFLLWENQTLGDVLGLLFAASGIALAVTIGVLLIRRYRAATPPLRRLLAPVYAFSLLTLGALVVANAVGSVWEPGGLVFGFVAVAFLSLVPIAFLGGLLRSRLARGSVANVVVAIGRGTPLRDALADALGDPSLSVAYWSERQREWVDEEGRALADPIAEPPRMASFVEHDGHRVAALVHDVSLADQPGLIEAVSAAASLQLANERLGAELRSQLALLDTAVNTAPSLLSVVDTHGRIRNFNRAVEQAVGVDDPEEIRGRLFWDVFIDPDEREGMRQRFLGSGPDFAPAVYENGFTNGKGERLVIQWSSAPIVEDGQVVAVVAGGLDITERKQRELELQLERDSTDTLVQTIPTLIVVTDDHGVVLLHEGRAGINRAFRDTLGWTDEQVGDRPFREFVAPGDAEALGVAIQAAVPEQPTAEQESRWRHADGRLVVVAWQAVTIPDPSEAGRRLVLVSGTDVTERKRRELELQRQRDFLDTVGESVPSLLVIVDTDAVIMPDSLNRPFRETFGWESEEAVGRSFLELVDPADQYAVLMAIAAAANGVERTDLEARWLPKDGGEPRVVAWTATPLPEVADRPLVLISGEDVTERKRQDEEIRASRKRIVQAADDARRRLERNLHDGAQQRLVSLSLSLRLAEAKLASDPAQAAEIIGGAREELAHALDELRELARGIHPAVLTERGLGAALEGVVLRTPLPVELELPAERLSPPVEAAAYYVISEALTNVAKYAEATSAHVRVTYDEGLELVHVEVADDGSGGADPEHGSGLRGLADRVAALDGTLLVESPQGVGTRIIAAIPVRDTVLSK